MVPGESRRLYRSVLRPRVSASLEQPEREMLEVAVSAANDCHY